MKIAVCINHVPDTASKIKIAADQKSIDSTGITYIINPYDEFAIEEALKTKEKFGGEVYVLSVGKDANKESIKRALAMGIDEGILLKNEEQLDSFNVAQVLANELKNLNPEIIFFGKQSVDYDNSIVGIIVAELLGYNCISVCVSLDITDGKVTAEREIEGGKEVVESSLPIVITTQKGLNEPRYPSLKGIMAAKKKNITEKPINNSNVKTETIKLKLPKPKEPGRILGTDASAIPELVRLLREEAKVI
ncbi:MAG: electron transfer flavoprotein subunit beta/FixA family protein [Ignavibacterium sp.]